MVNLKKAQRKNPAHGRSHWSQRKLHCKCPSQEEKERKPPKERTVKPSRTGLCKSGLSTHGPTTKSRNAATKRYNKRIYTTRKGNVGSKNGSKKVLRTKANVFDPTMQGRRSFTFEYEGTCRNPRFYEAKVVYSV